MEPTDLVGLPKVKGGTTSYCPPDSLPSSGRGLLAFEEINRAERFMQTPCLQLCTERRLNSYVLPCGWLPVASINPSGEGYAVTELDPALLSRFAAVRVVPDRVPWLEYARRRGIHPAVISYVDSDPSVFDHPDSNPRSWTYVSDLVQAAEKAQVSHSALRAAVLGTVGDARGKAFLASMKHLNLPLAPAQVLKAYAKHRSTLQAWIAEGRIDLVEGSLRSLLIHVQPETDFRRVQRNGAQWGNLGHFLWDLPGDLHESARVMFQERGYPFPPRLRPRKEPPHV